MKLRYAHPEPAAFKVIVGPLTLTIPPSGVVEVSDEDAQTILAKSQNFTAISDAPPIKVEPKAAPVREDLGPLVRVQVVPAHHSPAGFLIEGKTYKHDAQGFADVPAKIAERWIEQKRAKAEPTAPSNELAQPANPSEPTASAPKADDKPRSRRGQRAEEPQPTAQDSALTQPDAPQA